MIDLRSDTVTKPTPEMLEVMMQAEVGDDVFAEDPTVNALEAKAAEMFGMEAGLFCPSGTMTNQLAIKTHVLPGDEVICSDYSHIYNYEGGGIAMHSGASVRLVKGDQGRFTAQDVLDNINPVDDHYPRTSLVAVENTVNKGGGAIYDLNELKAIGKACKENGLKYHLDGARIFNALVAEGKSATDYHGIFDSISICLSKGLGCPVGSVLLGSKALVKRAHRFRKAFGGGMRQGGYLAAAGIYALDNHVQKLEQDHEKAKLLIAPLLKCKWVSGIEHVETNIVIFRLANNHSSEAMCRLMAQNGILALPFGPHKIRFVTHQDISFEDVAEVERILGSIQ